ncbi:ATP-dependent helicase HrpB [Stieleria varia]|uniref:ATP-dependent RNA helicase HrpB n=1 Tax=Stieleria varia TaxID=2528005 RepID=A0A5C6B763_9BACT|nr:ATP-dependent helicase HrpB [Stieleria varia]TWU07617.1 ATP-dependent RNA helicase HrpB [Stieleria varia]
MQSLPVTEILPEVIDALAARRTVVLRAPPGAGKTTGVPPEILDRPALGSGQILLVQPRRLAARSAALRLASLRNERIAQSVGYHVRFDRQVGNTTRLIAMTTGILLRRLTSDPLLEDVSCVILDEFHERSLEIDLALGMLHRIRTTLRPELQLVVMSATMDPQPVLELIDDAVAIESQGRAHDVQIHYAPHPSTEPIDHQIATVVRSAVDQTSGHLLVFLPGVGEIHRTSQRLSLAGLDNHFDLQKLFGEMSPEQQDSVLSESGRRKIILSTNVAETSVTIPGVTGVIDSGLARVLRFDDRVGLPELRLEPISQASAEQRAGRAGRTAPGHCWRLWTANTHRARPEQTACEILRTDFSGAALMLSAWGERDWTQFPWVTPPRDEAIESAQRLLGRLDAIDDSCGITEMGKQMVAMPLHPRLSRLLIEAQQHGVIDWATLAAALLSERSPFDKSDTPFQDTASHGVDCELMQRVAMLRDFAAGRFVPGIHPAAAKNILRVAENLSKQIELTVAPTPSAPITPSHQSDPVDLHQRFAKSLIVAFPDRVALRRLPGSDRGLMVGGRGVQLARSSRVKDSDLLLCLDADGKGREALVRMACTIQESWLPPSLRATRDELFFHPSLQAVVARRREYFDDLMLSESPVACEPSPQAAELLASHAMSKMDSLWGSDKSATRSLITRLRFAAEHPPAAGFPIIDDEALRGILMELCSTRTTMAQLQNAPWLDHLRGRFSYQQLCELDRHVPERLTVPSGNQYEIRYEPGKAPLLAVRIQEIFGWSETPRIASGRVALQLHLLGPNHRPQQITDDLASFWKTTYGVVRKELKRRYPKHHWPEDPTTAVATRNGLKPKVT